LWGFLDDGLVQLHELTRAEQTRMRELMKTYQDTPMDLADASLVAAAETLGVQRILTLDRHFYAYRINARTSFEIFP
jgi:predicted nucleic acid-binding protein